MMNGFEGLAHAIDFIIANHLSDNGQGCKEFEAIIEYKTSSKKITEITTVKINRSGYPLGGKVQLTETNILNLNNYHLEFNPEHQSYIFDEESNLLIISGKSDKMRGNYEVIIKVRY